MTDHSHAVKTQNDGTFSEGKCRRTGYVLQCRRLPRRFPRHRRRITLNKLNFVTNGC